MAFSGIRPQKQKSRSGVRGGSCFALAFAWMLLGAYPGWCHPTPLRLLHKDEEQYDDEQNKQFRGHFRAGAFILDMLVYCKQTVMSR